MGIFNIFTLGKSRKNPYLANVTKRISEVKLQQEAEKIAKEKTGARVNKYLDQLSTQLKEKEVRRGIKEDLAKARGRAEAGLGTFRTEPDTSGIDQENLNAPWIPVSSSNVEAIRYVGGNYGLQVRFKSKGWEYAYYDPTPGLYEDMLAAPSKGQFVWYRLRLGGVPYTRLTGGISPSRLAYNFGRTTGGTFGRELLRNPKFKIRPRNRQTGKFVKYK